MERPTNELFEATAMPDRDWWQALWPDPKRVLTDIGIRRGMHVVDLCCGDGYFTAPLGQLVKEVGPYHYGAIFDVAVGKDR